MPRYNLDDADSNEQYDNDGCMSDMERYERRNQMFEEQERFNAEIEDEDSLDALFGLDSDFVFGEDDEFEDEDDFEDEDEEE